MKPTYKFETFSRKPLLGRRQYYWRVRHQNGRTVDGCTEGYYNFQDMMNSYRRLKLAYEENRVVMPKGV